MMKEDLFKALKDRYTAQMSEAKATMKVYIDRPVGVGEHPDILGELNKMVEKYCEAKDKLETVKKIESEL